MLLCSQSFSYTLECTHAGIGSKFMAHVVISSSTEKKILSVYCAGVHFFGGWGLLFCCDFFFAG